MIASEFDPIGTSFINSNSAQTRRKTGSTYTPPELVEQMVALAAKSMKPDIIVDCGCGSGRFSIACARRFPQARIIAVDSSREACEMTRTTALRHGMSERIEVHETDFMDFKLPTKRGKTLWIGNPPYVRHHDIPESSKTKFKRLTERLGVKGSLLSGLHTYFLAQIAANWQAGDFGVLVTSAEWLDVNYGEFMRRILTEQLGLTSLEMFDKEERVFEDAMTTATVFSFGRPTENVPFSMHGGEKRTVSVRRLSNNGKWSNFLIQPDLRRRDGLVTLGSIASVHRGVVTGNNRFWVRSPEQIGADIPEELTVPIVSHAKEIMGDCIAQTNTDELNRLIVLPENLSSLHGHTRRVVGELIDQAIDLGVDKGYVASRRKAWWSIKPPKAPAIMMTYMARRAPVFVRNKAELPMLNVVHGIYPKRKMSDKELSRLVDYLNGNVQTSDGRTYCGGLTKFEPKEAEAIMVPEELETSWQG